jgi:hypothetical protein
VGLDYKNKNKIFHTQNNIYKNRMNPQIIIIVVCSNLQYFLEKLCVQSTLPALTLPVGFVE